jgi:hypothetical protein
MLPRRTYMTVWRIILKLQASFRGLDTEQARAGSRVTIVAGLLAQCQSLVKKKCAHETQADANRHTSVREPTANCNLALRGDWRNAGLLPRRTYETVWRVIL